MQYYHISVTHPHPSPGGVPEKEPLPKREPPKPGPEITPPPPPQGPPERVPHEIPEHDHDKRTPPDPKAEGLA